MLGDIASHINPSISGNADGKVPMMNVKMWIELINGRRRILYEQYEKEMATMTVMETISELSLLN